MKDLVKYSNLFHPQTTSVLWNQVHLLWTQ